MEAFEIGPGSLPLGSGVALVRANPDFGSGDWIPCLVRAYEVGELKVTIVDEKGPRFVTLYKDEERVLLKEVEDLTEITVETDGRSFEAVALKVMGLRGTQVPQQTFWEAQLDVQLSACGGLAKKQNVYQNIVLARNFPALNQDDASVPDILAQIRQHLKTAPADTKALWEVVPSETRVHLAKDSYGLDISEMVATPPPIQVNKLSKDNQIAIKAACAKLRSRGEAIELLKRFREFLPEREPKKLAGLFDHDMACQSKPNIKPGATLKDTLRAVLANSESLIDDVENTDAWVREDQLPLLPAPLMSIIMKALEEMSSRKLTKRLGWDIVRTYYQKMDKPKTKALPAAKQREPKKQLGAAFVAKSGVDASSGPNICDRIMAQHVPENIVAGLTFLRAEPADIEAFTEDPQSLLLQIALQRSDNLDGFTLSHWLNNKFKRP